MSTFWKIVVAATAGLIVGILGTILGSVIYDRRCTAAEEKAEAPAEQS